MCDHQVLISKNRPQWRFSINSLNPPFTSPSPKIKNPSVGGTEGGFNARSLRSDTAKTNGSTYHTTDKDVTLQRKLLLKNSNHFGFIICITEHVAEALVDQFTCKA